MLWEKKSFTVKNIIETVSPALEHRKETSKVSEIGSAILHESRERGTGSMGY